MHHRYHDEPIWPAEPPQFAKESFQVPDMIQHQAAEHPVETFALQRQSFLEIVPKKFYCFGAGFHPGALQHLGRDAATRPGETRRQSSKISSARSQETIAVEERRFRPGALLPGAGSYRGPGKILSRTAAALPARWVRRGIGDASGNVAARGAGPFHRSTIGPPDRSAKLRSPDGGLRNGSGRRGFGAR